MIEELKKHLQSSSPEQIKKEWDEVSEFEKVGPKALEFVNIIKPVESFKIRIKVKMKNIDLTITSSETKFIQHLYDLNIIRFKKVKESPSEGFEDYFNRPDHK